MRLFTRTNATTITIPALYFPGSFNNVSSGFYWLHVTNTHFTLPAPDASAIATAQPPIFTVETKAIIYSRTTFISLMLQPPVIAAIHHQPMFSDFDIFGGP